MKIEEVLEKTKALALEKGKFYLLILSDECQPNPIDIEWFDDPEAPELVVVFVPDPSEVKLFELTKEEDEHNA